MERKHLENRIKILSVYAVTSSIIILSMLALIGFYLVDKPNAPYPTANQDSFHIKHLTAERVDVVEPNGELGISLSNSRRTPLPSFDGKSLKGASNRNSPNIIFFDGQGDEVGGINFSNDHESGDAIRHLAFDGYSQDEVITLSHFIQNGRSRKGVYIYDKPDIHIMTALEEMGVLPEDSEEELNSKIQNFRRENPERYGDIWKSARRVALQTNNNAQAEILLGDELGNPRLRLAVGAEGGAMIEFLDENGQVIHRLHPKNP